MAKKKVSKAALVGLQEKFTAALSQLDNELKEAGAAEDIMVDDVAYIAASQPIPELVEASNTEEQNDPVEDLVIMAAQYDDYVPLARLKQGQLFRKQILLKGIPFSHPSDPKTKITVDNAFADSLVKNFEGGVCDIVQVPLCGDDNRHSEAPDRNIGEVIGLEQDDKGVYAIMDVRDAGHAGKMGKTYLGASGMLHMNYTDTRYGTKVGPTLLHVAVTNRPHVTGLDDFREVIAASADPNQQPVLLTPTSIEGDSMELSALKKLLRDEHNIDLDALQADRPVASSQDDVSAAVLSALEEAGVLNLSNGDVDDEITNEDVIGAIKELALEKLTLSGRIEGLETTRDEFQLAAATANIDNLVREGRVLPAQKEAMLTLSVDNPDLFNSIIPDKAIVPLSELGVAVHLEPDDDLDKEIARLSAAANGSK